MRVVAYLKNYIPIVLLIFVLLAGEAFADLMLPTYTGAIVDTGIQSRGVEHASPDVMSEGSYTFVLGDLNGESADLFAQSYQKTADGTFALTDQGGEDRATLDAIVAAPLAEAHGLPVSDDESIMQQTGVQAVLAEYESISHDIGAIQMAYLLKTGLIMMLITLAIMCCSICSAFFASRTSASIGRTLREQLFRRVVSFSDKEINSFSAASLITRGTNDITQIQNVTNVMLRMVMFAPIMATAAIVMVARTNIRMSWIAFLAVIAVAVMIGVLFAITVPKFRIMQQLVDRVNLTSREILTGLPVIRAFNRERFEEDRFKDANTDLMKTSLFTARAMVFMMPAISLILNIASVAIVWVGAGYVDAGEIQTGNVIAFLTYTMHIVFSFLIIGMVAILLPRADVAAQRINEVINTEPSIRDGAQSQTFDAQLGTGAGATVEFKDVSFHYDQSEGNVLEHISFSVPAGTTTAIIGSTGSGKSTVVKLLERFHDVTEGAILLDGVDIRELSQHALRKNLGYVPQKAFLFAGTIESNVKYGMGEGASDETMQQALEVSKSAAFVSAKEDGLQSEVSQGGTNVSGGQRQRLSIARALATDARVLLFDDSFSALDYRTDAELRQALQETMGGRTVMIVAQRISTVMNADQIIVLDEGQMVGLGTHDELMETCETYREIALSQLSEAELSRGGGAR